MSRWLLIVGVCLLSSTDASSADPMSTPATESARQIVERWQESKRQVHGGLITWMHRTILLLIAQ